MNTLLQLGAGLAIFYAVVKFFKTIESSLSEYSKNQITVWLKGQKPNIIIPNESAEKTNFSLAHTFSNLLDVVFTNKHLSLKCLYRSTLATFIAISLFTLLHYTIIDFNPFELLFINSESFFFWLLDFFGSILLISVLPDYISLLQSRFIIHKMKSSKSRGIILLLLIDFVLSAIIALFSVTIWLSLLYNVGGEFVSSGRYEFSFWLVINDFFDNLTQRGLFLSEKNASISMGSYFYATFITSIWVWIYVIGAYLLKFLPRLKSGKVLVLKLMDIDNKPLQSIGVVSGMFIALVYWVFLLF
ncbi:hypothetical protein [Aliikangiella coralliicola]|uniref:Uncharacterized protein n=1 Tax=Aliikangiella coralliicola TaxID=2592383 RepID=A0A545U052_9GAMM|nr:hypothetical protein [Aliikangiella coralliicola]TQV82844.1 hypothetical protein FLL46_24045 [Aliikangiella coralliicola]